MFGILKTIFGSGDVISKGLSLIDDIHTSTEEEIKAKSNAKVALMNAYAPFKIAQRFLMVITSINFFICMWVGVYLWVSDGDVEGFINLINEFKLGWIMTSIVVFYFGSGAVEGIIGKKNEKK